MKRTTLLIAAALLIPAAAQAQVLNFEGIAPTYPFVYPSDRIFIQEFYNGGTSSAGTSGPNYGVEFSPNAEAHCLNTIGVVCTNASRGGQGDPNSQESGLFFASGTSMFMNLAAGFTNGFSLFYTAPYFTGSFEVWSGLNGTGTLLASLMLGLTTYDCPPGYFAGYCTFVPAGVSFSGTARSVTLSGRPLFIVFDDVTFGSATPGQLPGTTTPEPMSTIVTGSGLAGVAAARRRRTHQG